MQFHTFKARSLADALRLVRDELGPDASVLHTRDVSSPLMRWLGGRLIEVTASVELAAPSRLDERPEMRVPPADEEDFCRKIRQDLAMAATTEPSLVEQLAAGRMPTSHNCFPAATSLAQRLRRAGVGEETISRWLDRLEAESICDPDCHEERRLDRLRQIIASELTETILR
jgi:flagellar biosynthesis protein FlhF